MCEYLWIQLLPAQKSILIKTFSFSVCTCVCAQEKKWAETEKKTNFLSLIKLCI